MENILLVYSALDAIWSFILVVLIVACWVVGTVLFWLVFMWVISKYSSEPAPEVKHMTPEEHEAYVEMTKKERRREAKKRLKNIKSAKRWFHDDEAAKWLEEHPDEEVA